MMRLSRLGLALLASVRVATCSWTVTGYYQAGTTCWDNGDCARTTHPVRPTGTELPRVTSTLTESNSWDDLTMVVLLVAKNAPVTSYDPFEEQRHTSTRFWQSTVLAITECPEAKPFPTSVELDVPFLAASLVTPTAVTTTYPEGTGLTYVDAFLEPGVATAVYGSYGNGAYGPYCNDYEPYKSRQEKHDKAVNIVIWIFGPIFIAWFTFLPIFGFIEVWWNLKRRLQGRKHHHGGIPFCWAAIIILPLIWVILNRGWRRQPARDEAQRERLMEAWKMYTGRQMWNWYWRYAYRKQQPEFLEDVASGMGVDEALRKQEDLVLERQKSVKTAKEKERAEKEQRKQDKLDSRKKIAPEVDVEKAETAPAQMPRSANLGLARVDEKVEGNEDRSGAESSQTRPGEPDEMDITEVSPGRQSSASLTEEKTPSVSKKDEMST